MRTKNIENKEHARKVVSKKNIIQILIMVVAVALVNFVFQYFSALPFRSDTGGSGSRSCYLLE
jgi:uncharacterized membrane protein YvbJ